MYEFDRTDEQNIVIHAQSTQEMRSIFIGKKNKDTCITSWLIPPYLKTGLTAIIVQKQ